MADFLTEKRREIEQRMKELRPLVDEYHQLEAAVAALGGAKAPAAKARAAAPTRSKGTGKRGRPKGSGKRAQQVLELVSQRPGITIPEIAGEIGIQQNYLYRVVPDLQKQGKIKKRKRGWYPV
jgi:predicted Rossmann fold nucleotide-binding protein DprA/Smf involved in DNA uptake